MSGIPTLSSTPTEAAPTNPFLRWFMPEVPLARVAVFRVFIYLFIIIDVLTISGDVIAHGWTPEFYQPLWLARFLHIPAVSVLGAQILLTFIIVFSLLAAAGILQRLSGWAAAITFGLWMFYTQGYGYVAHDHMALVIAAFVLPTVGTARFRDVGTASARAGWALRVVQIAVVLTYFYSVVMKWIASGNITQWANGAVIIWALMRRGAEWSKPFLEMPRPPHRRAMGDTRLRVPLACCAVPEGQVAVRGRGILLPLPPHDVSRAGHPLPADRHLLGGVPAPGEARAQALHQHRHRLNRGVVDPAERTDHSTYCDTFGRVRTHHGYDPACRRHPRQRHQRQSRIARRREPGEERDLVRGGDDRFDEPVVPDALDDVEVATGEMLDRGEDRVEGVSAGHSHPATIDDIVRGQLGAIGEPMVDGEGHVDGFAGERDDGEPVGAQGSFGDEAVCDDDIDISSQSREFVLGEVDIVHAQIDVRVVFPQPAQRIGKEVGERARQPGQGDLSNSFAEVALPLGLHPGERAGHVPTTVGEQPSRGGERESATGGFDQSVADLAPGLPQLLRDGRRGAMGDIGDGGDAAVFVEQAQQLEMLRIDDHEVMLQSR
jgi:hypothetical protein